MDKQDTTPAGQHPDYQAARPGLGLLADLIEPDEPLVDELIAERRAEEARERPQ
jgi:hypothetical protein